MTATRILMTAALRAIGGPTLRSLRSAAQNTGLAQREALQRIVDQNAATEFGRQHGFGEVRGPEEFRERVPIREYEAFRPWVRKIVAGEPDVLTADAPLFLARTSGTTGEPKLVPITKRFVGRQKQLTRAWMAAASSAHSGVLDHSALGIVSPAIDSVTDGGLPIGSSSGMIYRSTPAVLRRRYAIPEPVFSVSDYDVRYFLVARFALARRLSVIATPNPATLLRLTDVMHDEAEQLIAAIADGSLGPDTDLIGPAEEELRQQLRPDPDRARQLERFAAHVGGPRPVDAWPDLALVGCWLGGTSGLQAGRLAERFGHRPFRDLGYLASEGHFTVPLEDGTAGGLLDLVANFFEFVPEDDGCGATVLGAHEIEKGHRYRAIVTTSSGLYRYDMNDIVEVVGRLEGSPLVAFVRKSGEMTNLAGEKLHANHVIAALDALRSSGVRFVEAQLTARPDELRYQLAIEAEGDEELRPADLASAFDEALMRVNVEYAEKRRSRRLSTVSIEVEPGGWGEQIRRMRLPSSGSDAQVKWRYLVESAGAEPRTTAPVDGAPDPAEPVPSDSDTG